MAVGKSGESAKVFNGVSSGIPPYLGDRLDELLAIEIASQCPLEEKERLTVLAQALKDNERPSGDETLQRRLLAKSLTGDKISPEEEMLQREGLLQLQGLAEIRKTQLIGSTAQRWIDLAATNLPIVAIREEAADPQTDVFTWNRILGFRQNAIGQVRTLPPDQQVAAYVNLKERYGRETRYGRDTASRRLINGHKFESLPLDIFLGEIQNLKSKLFTKAEREKWCGPFAGEIGTFASEIKAVMEKPENKRLDDLVALKKKYDGNDNALGLIHRVVGDLSENIKIGAFQTHRSIFSAAQYKYLSDQSQRYGGSSP